LVVLKEAEWTPFQTHYFSENWVAPGIEPGTLTTRLQRWTNKMKDVAQLTLLSFAIFSFVSSSTLTKMANLVHIISKRNSEIWHISSLRFCCQELVT
jgi:hypothetical protein